MGPTLADCTLSAMSVEKQQAAAMAMLEAALLTGSDADVKALRAHAHELLDQAMDGKAQYAKAIKRVITP